MILHKPKNIFDNEQQSNASKDCSIYLLARQALYFYLKENNITKAYLPEYCAYGAYTAYLALNIEIKFYKIDKYLNIVNQDFKIEDNTIFHYIHHFGLFSQNNIDILTDLKLKGMRIIDDRALTLTEKPYKERFDSELYSLYKLCAVPAGGFLLDNGKNKKLIQQTADSRQQTELESKMTKHFEMYSSNLMSYFNSFSMKIFGKIAASKYDYASEAENYWLDQTEPSNKLVQLINNCDFEKTNRIAVNNAEFIFDNIDKSKLIVNSKQTYCSQALIGFPVLTDNPKALQNEMMKNGVLGFSLANGWNPASLDLGNHIIHKHYCLSCTAGLSQKELEIIVKTINKL